MLIAIFSISFSFASAPDYDVGKEVITVSEFTGEKIATVNIKSLEVVVYDDNYEVEVNRIDSKDYKYFIGIATRLKTSDMQHIRCIGLANVNRHYLRKMKQRKNTLKPSVVYSSSGGLPYNQKFS